MGARPAVASPVASKRRRSHGDIMRIHVGCEVSFEFSQTTPMIVTLNVHFSRFSDLERPDHLVTKPSVPIEGYRDSLRSEEHTSELQSRSDLVCRLLLEKKKKTIK